MRTRQMLETFTSLTLSHLNLRELNPPIDSILASTDGMLITFGNDTQEHNEYDDIPSIRVTLIGRLGSRKIINEARLVEAMRSAYPDNIEVNVIHFEALTFPEQVEALR